MAFCSCGRKIVRFLVLSIYLGIYLGLRTVVVANRSNIEVVIQDKQADSPTDSYQIPMSNSEQIERRVSVPKHRSKRRGETKEPLPAKIRATAIAYLQQSYHQSTIMASMSFSLLCHNNLTKLIYKRFPMADLFWEFNDQPLSIDPSRTWYKPLINELTILVAGPNDSGVYACKMAQNWYWEQTVEFFVVQVQSFKPTIASREQVAMTLSCNSEILNELFPSINRTWRHNGEMVFSGTGTEGETLTVHHTKPTDGGVWECTVANSGRTWLTSHVNVSVLPSLSLWELVLSEPRFMIGAIGVLCTGCMVFFFICYGLAHWSDKRDHEERLYFAEHLKAMRKRQGGTKRRDSWEASDPPIRDRSPQKYSLDKLLPTTSGRNETEPEKSKRRDFWEASDPPSRDRSPHKSSHDKVWPSTSGRN